MAFSIEVQNATLHLIEKVRQLPPVPAKRALPRYGVTTKTPLTTNCNGGSFFSIAHSVKGHQPTKG